ncbi:MAG: hypothetical protein RLO05_07025, partial [Rhodospirillales bacterium]
RLPRPPAKTNRPALLMKSISKIIFILALALVLGGGTFLVTWDFPAPSKDVTKVLPDDRFPR